MYDLGKGIFPFFIYSILWHYASICLIYKLLSMNKNGEILIVEDDGDDRDMICEALKDLKIRNEVFCFNSAHDVLAHLRKVDSDPFFILCDLRMPLVNGLELKQMIYADENLIKKAVPFILCSTTIDSSVFNTALAVGVQGFFVKPPSMQELIDLLETILKYMNDIMGNSDFRKLGKTA